MPSRRVAELARGERLAPENAVRFLVALGRFLEGRERAASRGGLAPVGPDSLLVDLDARDDAGLITADHDGETASAETRLDWTPPPQLDGAPWDAAADRFVAGLLAYRLVAGVHPARGEARVRLDARWIPPPFPGEVARTLPLGVQSLILELLDPDPSRRPASAREVRRRAAALASGGRNDRREGTPVAVRRAAAPVDAARSRAGRWLVLAAVVAAVAALLPPIFSRDLARPDVERASARTAGAATARPVAEMSPESCAGCHPREVAEWSRSAMAFAAQSPLFGALESAVEEQVGVSTECPGGAGVLRSRDGRNADVCVDRRSGDAITGSGGEGWCTRCHLPNDGHDASRAGTASLPAWSTGDARSRRPVRDLAPEATRAGIGCIVCHAALAPEHDRGARVAGNPDWTSFVTGARFTSRPEDDRGLLGIANSGYRFDRARFLTSDLAADGTPHGRADDETKRYVRSSEACGACHDVRLFGTDVLGGSERGEHFKRLRNVYSEWRAWADEEKSAGRTPATCQDCHMSLYPGVCTRGDGGSAEANVGCPGGTHFEARPPGAYPRGRVALSSAGESSVVFHGFTSVDLPLSAGFSDAWIADPSLDANGVPRGLTARRTQLLRHTFSLSIDGAHREGGQLVVPVQLTNRGAGHRVPAGFSQERETWVELEVRDGRGALVYQVGHLDRPTENLRDKVFEEVRVDHEDGRFAEASSTGIFGADVRDGPDVPRWTLDPESGGARAPVFRGLGLINLQNGFLRCVSCIGTIDARGVCQADRSRGQGELRADRFTDGAYDLDTGECRSNLQGRNALFETYFPIGALDAERGVAKAPDAIVDTRSAAPGVTTTYRYEIPLPARALAASGPFQVRAVLHFRPFPPFLLDAFVRYEAEQARLGRRPSGPQITSAALARLDVVDLAEVQASLP